MVAKGEIVTVINGMSSRFAYSTWTSFCKYQHSHNGHEISMGLVPKIPNAHDIGLSIRLGKLDHHSRQLGSSRIPAGRSKLKSVQFMIRGGWTQLINLCC